MCIRDESFFFTPCNAYQDEDDEEDDEEDGDYSLYTVQGTLREWVTRDEVRRLIARKFKEFILTYVNPKNDHGEEYVRLINEMVSGKFVDCPP